MEKISRREFVKGSAASSLIIAISVPTSKNRAYAGDADGFANHYFEITPDGQYYFTMDKSEMGQGVITGQVTMFAEEIDIDPSRFEVRTAPVAAIYGTMAGQQITGGSTSTKDRYSVLRQAGANTRALLIQAAAKKWNTSVSSIRTDNGVLIGPQEQKLNYSDVIQIAQQTKLQQPATIKDPADFKYIGKRSINIDAKTKSNGTAIFGMDESLPDMLVAVIIRSPEIGAKLKSFNADETKKLPGVKSVVEISSGLAIVCEKYWQTIKARESISVEWDSGSNKDISSASIIKQYRDKMNQDSKDSPSSPISTLKAEYELPYLAHSAMEPMNAIAHVTEKGCEILSPTQSPTMVRNEAARFLCIARDKVTVKTTKFLGGGFGRRSTLDYTQEAVEISKQLKRPIKVIWSREDDTKFSPARPINFHQMRASFKDGRIVAWEHKLGCESILQQRMPEFIPLMLPEWIPGFLARGVGFTAKGIMSLFGLSPTTGEGAEPPYAIAKKTVQQYTLGLDIPIHFWRSVGHSYNGFVVESFFDQCAHELKADPYLLRKEMLSKDSRLNQVLDIVYHKSNFANPGDRALGIACHFSFESYAAQVAEVEVIGKEIQVKRVYCAIDCGTVVNPDIVRAQMESGIIYGLSAALHGELTLENGGFQQANFDSYAPLRINQSPEIEVFLVESKKPPTGVGEPGLPPIAAAVGNAIFKATGQRLTKLPFRL